MKSSKNLREELSLNRGWLFCREDLKQTTVDGHVRAYLQSKTRVTEGIVSQSFDDSAWKKVDLPHDFVLASIPQKEIPGFCGCRERGIVWYRRHFQLSESDKGKNIEIQFEGISTSAEVYFNGALVCRNFNGYTSFYCDVTPMAEYGNFINTLSVRVDASHGEGWWYEGGGIYRDVWLVKRNPQHFLTNGIYANPIQNAKGVWHIPFEAEVTNTGTKDKKVFAELTLLDPDGAIVAKKKTECETVKVFETNCLKTDWKMSKSVRLWDLESPELYTLQARLYSQSGKLLDETSVRCGFRTIAFDGESGFSLNGRHVLIQGTCNHQDHACVGVAVPKSVEYFRIRKLKEMGCNAYRCSHNPPSRSLLDVCDELGMLVMDENRHFSTSEEHLNELHWLVKRDRNHPCVILWSLFNEEPLQGAPIGYELTRKMSAVVKQLDSTRFTTAAMNGGILNEVNASQILDVTGINYYPHEYDPYHQKNPTHPVLSSEDTSAVTSRGEFVTDWPHNLLADNDTEAVPWGATQRNSWKAIHSRPWMAGCFVWTGFDYRGEPTPFPFPANSSFFGIYDICGFPKNAFYIRQAQWRNDLTVLKIAPHWNLKVKKGTPVNVLVISNAYKVELFLNDRSMGSQTADYYEMNSFQVPYETGVLRAVSYDKHGTKIAEEIQETTGKPVAIELIPDRTEIADDGYDSLPVTVLVRDRKGRMVPNADPSISFDISNNAKIVGTGNGNSNFIGSELVSERALYNGYAQVMVRTAVDAHGQLVLRASAPGLKSAEITIRIRENAADRLYEPVPERFRMFNDWIRSPFSSEPPDPNQVLDQGDMNSWERILPGNKLTPGKNGFVLCRADLSEIDSMGKSIFFQSIMGTAEFFLDGTLLASKSVPAAESFHLRLPANQKGSCLTVRLKADEFGIAGLTGPVVMDH